MGRWTGLVASKASIRLSFRVVKTAEELQVCRPAAPSGMTGRLYSEERHPSLDKQFYYPAATFFLP